MILMLLVGVVSTWQSQTGVATATIEILDVTYENPSQRICSMKFRFVHDEAKLEHSESDRYVVRHWVVFREPLVEASMVQAGEKVSFRYRPRSNWWAMKEDPKRKAVRAVGLSTDSVAEWFQESFDVDAFEQLDD